MAMAVRQQTNHRRGRNYRSIELIEAAENGFTPRSQSWEYFRRADPHKLFAVDGTSFAIMKRARIWLAYAFTALPSSASGWWRSSCESQFDGRFKNAANR
jgi:hypothetical protein